MTASSKAQDSIARLRTRIKAQRDWIAEHGMNKAGYVIRYEANGYSAAEAIAIYEADKLALDALLAEHDALVKR